MLFPTPGADIKGGKRRPFVQAFQHGLKRVIKRWSKPVFWLVVRLGMALVMLAQTANGVLAAPLAVPTVGITVNLPGGGSGFVGQPFTYHVIFDNTSGNPNDTGYGPFVDLLLPKTGHDGYNPPYSQTQDGISFSQVTYQGNTWSPAPQVFTFAVDAVRHEACITHPYLLSHSSGLPVRYCLDATYAPGYTPLADDIVLGTMWRPGDQFVTFLLPFGSYQPSQPVVDLSVSVNLSNLANVGYALPIWTRGGFRFGANALNDPTADFPITSGWTASTYTPTLFSMSKSDSANQTVSGPNWPHYYNLQVDIADQQSVQNPVMNDYLPLNLQFLSAVNAQEHGSNVATTPVPPMPPAAGTPGGEVHFQFPDVTGNASANDVSMRLNYYVPFRDAQSVSVPVIDPNTGDAVNVANQMSMSAGWLALDPRDRYFTPNPPVLAVSKTVALAPAGDVNSDGIVNPGDTLRYTIKIDNTGGQDASNLVLTETVPTNTAYSGTGWTCSSPSAGSTCTYPISPAVFSLPWNPGTVSVPFDVTVLNPFPDGPKTVSSAAGSVTAGTPSGYNHATSALNTVIVAQPAVTAVKHVSLEIDADHNGQVSPGDTLKYTVTIRNSGSQDAGAVVFGDTPDSHTGLVNGSVTALPGGSIASGNGSRDSSVSVDMGTLAGQNHAVTITFNALVSSTLPADITITNQGSVSGDNFTTLATNTTSTLVTAAPDMRAVLSAALAPGGDLDSNGFVSPGDTLRYTLSLSNAGSSSANGVSAQLTIPTHTTYTGTGWNCVPDHNAGSTCTPSPALGSLANGASTSLTLDVTLVNPYPASAGLLELSNTAAVSGGNFTAFNSNTIKTQVKAAPAVSASSGAPSTIPSTSNLQYPITITNNGNQDAASVTITEVVPANTTFDKTDSSTGWSCSDSDPAGTVCAYFISSLSTGDANKLLIHFAVSPVSTGVAVVTADKSVSLFNDADGNNRITPGDTLRYTLTLRNNGDADAGSILVGEKVPQGATYSGTGWTCSPDSSADSTCTQTVTDLLPGSDTPLTFDVMVVSPLPGDVSTITNNATVTFESITNSIITVSAGPVVSIVQAAPIIGLTKTADKTTAVSGKTITYSLALQNTGSQTANGLVLHETVPANTTYSGTGWICTNSPTCTTYDYTVGSLTPSSLPTTFYFAVNVIGSLPVGVIRISNSATVTGSNISEISSGPFDIPVGDTTAVAPVVAVVVKSATLQTDADSSGGITPGDSLAYTVEITNSGGREASAVIYQHLPGAGLTPGSATAALDGVPVTITTNPDGSLNLGPLPGAGGKITLAFNALIDSALGAAHVDYTGSAYGANFSPVMSNTLTTPVGAAAATSTPARTATATKTPLGTPPPTSTPMPTATPTIGPTRTPPGVFVPVQLTSDPGGHAQSIPPSPLGSYEDNFTAHSLLVGNGMNDPLVGSGYTKPGNIVAVTVHFDISDYFGFKNLVINDTLSDGLHWYTDSTHQPELQVNDNGSTYTIPAGTTWQASGLSSSGYTNIQLAPHYSSPADGIATDGTDGTTALAFNLSNELLAIGKDGKVVGGCIPSRTSGTGVGVDPNCANYNDGPTEGWITFYAQVQQAFTDNAPSGEPYIDQGDHLDNSATVTGDVLRYDTMAPSTYQESDGSSSQLSVQQGGLSKNIYAINGDTNYIGNPQFYKIDHPLISPGDRVTYELTYNMNTSNVEAFQLDDFLPLPVFLNTEVTVLDAGKAAVGYVPAAGHAILAPNDTFSDYSGIRPALSPENGNDLRFFYGTDYQSGQTATRVHIYFTVTVQDVPMADGLFLTNQVQSTDGTTFKNVQTANSIVQVEVNAPHLVVQKGVVAASSIPTGAFHPQPQYSPAAPYPTASGFTFLAVGSNNPETSGTYTCPRTIGNGGKLTSALMGTNPSTGAHTNPIGSDISGLDAGDRVTFAMVVENTGDGGKGAFDVAVRDSLDPGLTFVPGTLCFSLGDRTALAAGTQYFKTGTRAAPTESDFFSGGVEFADRDSSGNISADADKLGSNDASSGLLSFYQYGNNSNATTGANLLLVTYDAIVNTTINPGQSLTNTGVISKYGAFDESGTNYAAAGLTADAHVIGYDPQVVKGLDGTELGNGPLLAIGEEATYTLTISLPQGTLTHAKITDTLSSGLTFVDIQSLTVSSSTYVRCGSDQHVCNITDASAAPQSGGTPAYTGEKVVLSLGDLVNLDTDNSTTQTLTINYRALARNMGSNNKTTTGLGNSAVLSWTGGSIAAVSASSTMAVIEPDLQALKAVSVTHNGSAGSTGDSGDPITYTITISHAVDSQTDAYNVVLSDTLPGTGSVPYFNINTVTCSIGGSACAGFSQSLTGLTFTAGFDKLASGKSALITINGLLNSSLPLGTTINNTAHVTWTSLPGDVTTPRVASDPFSVERTGLSTDPGEIVKDKSGNDVSVNQYAANSSTASATSLSPTFVKSLFTTGIGAKDGKVVIGETATYHLTITVPQGTLPGVVVTDVLDPGLVFKDITSVTADNGLVSSDRGVFQPNCSSTPCNYFLSSVSADGRTVVFNLGKLVNLASGSGSETVTIAYEALALNVSGNKAGTAGLKNSAQMSYSVNGSPVVPPLTAVASDGLAVIEPQLNTPALAVSVVHQSVSGTVGDSGDAVTYTLTLTNPSADASTAYNTMAELAIPVQVDPLSITYDYDLSDCSGGCTKPARVGSFTLSGSTYHAIDQAHGIDLPPGATAKLVFTGTISATGLAPKASISTTAVARWSSLSGDQTASLCPAVTDPTTSLACVERTGADILPGTGINNYALQSNAPAFTVAVPALAKALVQTGIESPQPLNQNDKTHAVIGEMVDYSLTVTIPDGAAVNGVTLSDSLPGGLSFVEIQSISTGTGTHLTSTRGSLSSCDISNSNCAAFLNSVDTTGDQIINFDLGDITSSSTGNSNESVVITYRAVVLNTLGNQAGKPPLINSASLNYTGGSDGPKTASLTVIEPSVSIAKSADRSGTVQSGDAINYTITITNTGVTDAYNLEVKDVLDAGVKYESSDPGSLYDSGTRTVTWNKFDMAYGASAVNLHLKVTVLGSLNAGDPVVNNASVTWTSLGGSTNTDLCPKSGGSYNAYCFERTGSSSDPGSPDGSVNDYNKSSTVSLAVAYPAAQAKTIVATSETETPPGYLAVGEIVRYHVAFQIYRAVMPDFQVRDFLPPGLQFLNDGTAMAAFVSPNNGDCSAASKTVTSTTLSDAPWMCGSAASVTPGYVLTGNTISTSPSLDDTNFGDGTNVYFKLGKVTNTDTGSAFVVVEFNAVVLNVAGNKAGNSLVNSAEALINAVPTNTTTSIAAVVVEPHVSVFSKVLETPLPKDAGDTAVYTITVTNASGVNVSPANDVAVLDSLNAGLDLNSVAVVLTNAGIQSYAPADLSIKDHNGTDKVDLTISRIDPGGSAVITVTTRVRDTATAGQTIGNSASLAYSSLPADGTPKTDTTNNPTGSQAGTPGTSTGERDGGGTGLNTYTATVSSLSFTLDTPLIDKKPVAAPAQFTIGQTVTYNILVTLPEGATQNLSVTDDLPAGLLFESYQIITTAAGSSGLLTGDYAGTLTLTSNTPSTSGEDLVLTFGNVTNPGVKNLASDNQFIVQVTARVMDIDTNVRGSTLNNMAYLDYGSSGTIKVDSSGGAIPITIVEPKVSSAKSLLIQRSGSTVTTAQAGDVLTYTVTFSNDNDSNSSTAYAVTANDVLPPGTSFTSLSKCELINTQTHARTDITSHSNASSAGQIVSFAGNLLTPWDIPAGYAVECVYTASVDSSVYLASTLANAVDADWNSLPTTGNPDRRIYNDTASYPNSVDGSQDSTSKSFDTGTVTFSKDDGGVTVAVVNDTIHYTLTLNGALGTLHTLTVTDTLPVGLYYLNTTPITIDGLTGSSPSLDISPASSDGSGTQVMTWTFGDVVKSKDTATIKFDASVANIIHNSNGSPITNTARMTYFSSDGTKQDSLDKTDSFNLSEPQITSSKSVAITRLGFSVLTAQSGDVLTYTVDFKNTGGSTAYNVTAVDTLPAGTSFGSLTDCFSFTNPLTKTKITGSTIVTHPGQSVNFVGLTSSDWAILPGDTIECVYTASVGSGIYVNGTYSTSVDANWTNQQTNSSRIYDDGINGHTLYSVDGTQDTAAAGFTVDVLTFTKAQDNTTRTIGQNVQYTLTVGGPIGTVRNLKIVDTLPAGMIYNGDAGNTGLTTLTPTVSSPNNGTAAVTVTWDFGATTDKTIANATIVFTAKVADVIGNQIAGTQNNRASLDYHMADDTAAGQVTDSKTFTINEPHIKLTKTASPIAAIQVGTKVTYTLKLDNIGSSPAYNILVSDVLAQGMSYDNNSATCGATAMGVSGTGTGADPLILMVPGTISIAALGTTSCTYTATAQTGFYLNGAHNNNANANWYGLDSVDANAAYRRYYHDLPGYTADDSQDLSSATITTDVLTLSKSHDFDTRTIGQNVVYTLSIGGPTGTVKHLVVKDTLPQGLIFVGAVISGLPNTSNNAIAVNDGSAAVPLEWDFGDALKSSDPATITITARVADVAGNHASGTATTFSNSASVDYQDVNGTAVGTLHASDTPVITVVEPSLSISKTSVSTPTDAGDTIHYQVDVTASSAAHTADAYDVVVTDSLPLTVAPLTVGLSILKVTGGTIAITCPVGSVCTNLSTTGTPDVVSVGVDKLLPGAVLRVTFDARVQDVQAVGLAIANQANVTWTSLPGNVSGERFGGTGVDNYNGSSTKTITPGGVPAVDKQNLAAPAKYTIGDSVPYDILVTLPEGVTRALRVVDVLPAGLVYQGYSIIATSAGSGGLLGKDYNGGAAVSSGPAVGATGSLTFTFGDTLTPWDNDTGNNAFILRVTARVDNVGSNQQGTVLTNNASLLYKSGLSAGDTTKNDATPVSLTIIEPQVTVTKTITNPGAVKQAGSTVDYRVKFANSGDSPAYEVSATDTLANNMAYGTLTGCILTPGAVNLTSSTTVDTSVAGKVTFSGAAWDIPAGGDITCDYTAVIQNAALLDGTYTNAIDPYAWTSQNGSDPNERHYQDKGTYNVDKNQNPVTAQFSVGTLTLSKSHDFDTRTIGQNVVYTLSIGGPTGTVKHLVVKDTLPQGLIFVGAVISGLPNTSNNAIAVNDGSAAVPLEWDFGDALKSSDPATITITARVADVVGNHASGTATTFSNSASVDYQNAGGTPETTVPASDTPVITVVEPVLTLNKQIVTPPSPVDGGGQVTYRITFTNVGDAAAFHAILTDTLPAQLTLNSTSGSVVVLAGGGAVGVSDSSGVNDPLHGSNSQVKVIVDSIPVGGSVQIDYTVTINHSVTPNQTLINTGDVTWKSLALTDPNYTHARGSGSGLWDAANAAALVDKYELQRSAQFTTIRPAVTKTTQPLISTATLGQEVTYALKVTIPDGTTSGLKVVDTLPTGMVYVAGSAQVSSSEFASPVVSLGTVTYDSTLNKVTLPLNTIVLDDDGNTANNSFTITLITRVRDVIGNVGSPSTALSNSATVESDTSPTSAPVTANVNVVEPVLSIHKSLDAISLVNLAPGEKVRYNIDVKNSGSAPAYNVTIDDILYASQQQINFDPGSIIDLTSITNTIKDGFSMQTSAPAGDGSFKVSYVGKNVSGGGSIPADNQAYTFTFEATVSSLVIPGSWDNVATISTASSLPGVSPLPDERVYPPVSSTETVRINANAIDLSISKAVVDNGSGSNATSVKPGKVLSFDLNVANHGNRIANSVTLKEHVPQYTTLDPSSIILGWHCDPEPAGCTYTLPAPSTLAAGTNVSVRFNLLIDDPLPKEAVQISNSASVQASLGDGGDATLSDNTSSTVIVPLDAAPLITVIKDDGLSLAAPDATLPYKITITNTGNQEATDVTVTDTLPVVGPTNHYVTFVSAVCPQPYPSVSATPIPVHYDASTGVITWDKFNLVGADHQTTHNSIICTVVAKVNSADQLPGDVISDMIIHNAVKVDYLDKFDALHGNAQALTVSATDDDRVGGQSKYYVNTNQTFTERLDVAVGEVVTYGVSLNITSQGAANVSLTDTMDTGLAFISCKIIVPLNNANQPLLSTTSDSRTFAEICDPKKPYLTLPAVPGDPAADVSYHARQFKLDFGNISNSSNAPQTLEVQYQAAVLDSALVKRGTLLKNHATWNWVGGPLNADLVNTPLVVVEPSLTMSMKTDIDTVLPGGLVNFFVTLNHLPSASNTDAFDLIYTNLLPKGLTYEPKSFQVLSGPDINLTKSTMDGTQIKIDWDALTLTQSQVKFKFGVRVAPSVGYGQKFDDIANLEWTSLPGDYRTPYTPVAVDDPFPRVPQSTYNDLSTERYYDPASPVDLYGTKVTLSLRTPDETSPKTGFTPGRVTHLPLQPLADAYLAQDDLVLEIPSLNFKLPVTGIPLKSNGWDLTWLSNQVGYLQGTAFPTFNGNSVLTGHVVDANGKEGPFAHLNDLNWGDTLIIHYHGKQYIYEVREKVRLKPNDLYPFRHMDLNWLTLITCQDYDPATKDYLWRVVVGGALIKVKPE